MMDRRADDDGTETTELISQRESRPRDVEEGAAGSARSSSSGSDTEAAAPISAGGADAWLRLQQFRMRSQEQREMEQRERMMEEVEQEQRAQVWMAVVVIVLVMTFPPAAFLGLGLVLLFLLPCYRIWATLLAQRRAAVRDASAPRPPGSAAPNPTAGAGSSPNRPLTAGQMAMPRDMALLLAQARGFNAANARLMLINRDFGDADYETLIALDREAEGTELRARQRAESGAVAAVLAGLCHGPYAARRKREQDAEDPAAAAAESEADDDEDAPCCVVCMDDLEAGQDVATLTCAHQFHTPCITSWIKTAGVTASCPICKTSIASQRHD